MIRRILVFIGSMPKPRTNKRIQLLGKLAPVELLCWDRCNETQLSLPDIPGLRATVLKIPAANDVARRAIPYLKFSLRAYREIRRIDPDVIDVEGLDMLEIALRFKRAAKHPVRILFEVPDLRPLLTEKQTSPYRKLLQRYILWRERVDMPRTDLTIILSPRYYREHFAGICEEEKFFLFPNLPEAWVFEGYRRKETDPEAPPTDPKALTVGWIGGLRYKKQMRMLLEAARKSGWRIFIAGYEKEPQEIYPLVKDDPAVEWHGAFRFEAEAAALYGRCDLIYAVYDLTRTNERLLVPGKLYEAAYCGLPTVVGRGSYAEELVSSWGAGFAVDADDVEELTRALTELRQDPAKLKAMEEACRAQRDTLRPEVYEEALLSRVRAWFTEEEGA